MLRLLSSGAAICLLFSAAWSVSTMAPGQACTWAAPFPTIVFQRPHGEIFGALQPGETFQAAARTADGWLGFDPGVAQAANTGVFRLRWRRPEDAGVPLSISCAALPVVAAPAPGVCFQMPLENLPVRAAPRSSAAVLVVMKPGDFAAVLGRSAVGGWAQLDLSQGNTGLTGVGWIPSDALNLNGPCGDLSAVLRDLGVGLAHQK